MSQRVRFFAPDNIAAELTVADVPGPISAAAEGWGRLPGLSAPVWEIASLVHERPDVVAGPLGRMPPTFLQGDWKMGNLGSHPDGRTILLDWAYPGSGPACWDLCWYLALNRARLPEPKEAAIDRFRGALETRHQHRAVVGPAARPVHHRHHGHVRLGEGTRRPRRTGMVGGSCRPRR
jgi:hypothetical protein